MAVTQEEKALITAFNSNQMPNMNVNDANSDYYKDGRASHLAPQNIKYSDMYDNVRLWHSEMQRANEVLNHRQSQGLDISSQQNYLNKLREIERTQLTSPEEVIQRGMFSSYDSTMMGQRAMLEQQRTQALADLEKAYSQAISDGEMSVRDAQRAFEEQKKSIEQQAYLDSQSTSLAGHDMGIQNSQQLIGLMQGDNARRNNLTQSAMTERDARVLELQNRIKQLNANKALDMATANSNYYTGLTQAQAQAQAQLHNNLTQFDVGNYNMNREQAFAREQMTTQQRYALEQMAKQHGYDLSKMSQSQIYELEQMSRQHGYNQEMSAMEFNQRMQQMQAEIKASQEAELREYDLAVQRELAKYKPGTNEYRIRENQLANERRALLTEMATQTQFDVISKQILGMEASDPGAKPKRSDFNKWYLPKAKEEENYQKALKEWEERSSAYKRQLDFMNDPMSAFPNY